LPSTLSIFNCAGGTLSAEGERNTSPPMGQVPTHGQQAKKPLQLENKIAKSITVTRKLITTLFFMLKPPKKICKKSKFFKIEILF